MRVETNLGYVEVGSVEGVDISFAPDTECLPGVPICGLCEEKLSDFIEGQTFKPYEFE